MRFRIHIRVDPQSRPQFVTTALGDFDQVGQLSLRLDIEPADLGGDGLLDLIVGLAHAGVNDPRGIGPTGQGPVQLTAADHIHARPALGQEAYDVDVLTALDRVTDDRLQLAKGLFRLRVMIYKC